MACSVSEDQTRHFLLWALMPELIKVSYSAWKLVGAKYMRAICITTVAITIKINGALQTILATSGDPSCYLLPSFSGTTPTELGPVFPEPSKLYPQ